MMRPSGYATFGLMWSQICIYLLDFRIYATTGRKYRRDLRTEKAEPLVLMKNWIRSKQSLTTGRLNTLGSAKSYIINDSGIS